MKTIPYLRPHVSAPVSFCMAGEPSERFRHVKELGFPSPNVSGSCAPEPLLPGVWVRSMFCSLLAFLSCPSHSVVLRSVVLAVSAEAVPFPVLALSVMPRGRKHGRVAAQASASQPGCASWGSRGSSGRASAKASDSQPVGASRGARVSASASQPGCASRGSRGSSGRAAAEVIDSEPVGASRGARASASASQPGPETRSLSATLHMGSYNFEVEQQQLEGRASKDLLHALALKVEHAVDEGEVALDFFIGCGVGGHKQGLPAIGKEYSDVLAPAFGEGVQAEALQSYTAAWNLGVRLGCPEADAAVLHKIKSLVIQLDSSKIVEPQLAMWAFKVIDESLEHYGFLFVASLEVTQLCLMFGFQNHESSNCTERLNVCFSTLDLARWSHIGFFWCSAPITI